MKMNDDDIKKAFAQMEIPDPSESARRKAVQEAMDAFVKKNVHAEKRSKGIIGLIRQTGKTLRKIILLKGEPIMTQRQFATAGILVIAVGLFLTIGPQVFHTTQIRVETQVPQKQQVQPGIDEDPKALVDKRQENETAPKANRPSESRVGREKAKAPEVARRISAEDQVMQEEQYRAVPQAVVPGKKEQGGLALRSVTGEQKPGRIGQKMAFESVSSPDIQPPGYYRDEGRDRFTKITPNRVKLAAEEPVSTFSIDVDTASYAFVRRQLHNGLLPQKDAVRVEELINYFTYDYAVPQNPDQPFAPTVAVYPTPWNNNTRLLHIGIKGYDIVPAVKPRSNLVFLLDVSGSMNSPDKLPLLKNSFAMLVDTLDPEDTVAIVVYAGAAGTVLEPTKVKEKGRILASLEKLRAGGSTAGGQGIRLAYALAEMNFDSKAVNRVILATDGDFNVGITNQQELQSFIERKRRTGIFLSVLGFGQGNYNDALMQTLAQNGNGNAAYIDSLNEARKVLVDEAGSTLFPIAKDVKIQIEFNPARVRDYRLIGYETRLLHREDFNNDRVDAGDVGSGHSVTAIYEFTPAESSKGLIDDLRYRKAVERDAAAGESEYAFLKIRYKLPQEDTSRLITMPVTGKQVFEGISSVPQDMRFAAAVAVFGQLLRSDPYTGAFSYDDILGLAASARGKDPFGYRSEFLNLVRLAKTAKAM